MKNLLIVALVIILGFMFYDYFVYDDVVVITVNHQPTSVVYPYNPPQDFPTSQPAAVPNHVRSTAAPSGNIGNHDTGRTDSRTP